jgi:hypothetical protein
VPQPTTLPGALIWICISSKFSKLFLTQGTIPPKTDTTFRPWTDITPKGAGHTEEDMRRSFIVSVPENCSSLRYVLHTSTRPGRDVTDGDTEGIFIAPRRRDTIRYFCLDLNPTQQRLSLWLRRPVRSLPGRVCRIIWVDFAERTRKGCQTQHAKLHTPFSIRT